jgi:hypothetical protein
MLRNLVSLLRFPIHIVYVLHTSRTEWPLGRYESPFLVLEEVYGFLNRFGPFLEEDARHDIWLHSPTSEVTFGLNRFNMLYVYGSLDAAAERLRDSDVQEVAAWAAPRPPSPYVLHFHPDFDEIEREVLRKYAWERTVIPPQDVQHWTGPRAG